MIRHLRFLALALACIAIPLQSGAQRLGRQQKRPSIKAVADTNDAQAYLDYGVEMFAKQPADAAVGAFYWAARLNPRSAEALYSYWASSILNDRSILSTYMDGSRRAKASSRELRALDSLQFRAMMLNPFLYRRLDHPMFVEYVLRSMRESAGAFDYTESSLRYAVDSYLRSADGATRAWVSYSEGNFPVALQRYAFAMSSGREKAFYRIERGRIFGMRAQADSAIAEFNAALAELRKRDAKELVVLYDSKAMVEHSIGVLREQTDDVKGAREAYGRALQEDLAFYPAHLRLSLLAQTAGDTATAISEMELAAQVAPNEPYVRHMYGSTLAALGRRDEAIAQFTKALALEPYFALPHLALAQLHESAHNNPGARAEYAAFLQHAAKRDPQRETAEQRLAALGKGP